MVGLISSILVASPFCFGEQTWTDAYKKYREFRDANRAVVQRRVVPRDTAFGDVQNNVEFQVQRKTTAYTGPTSGPRAAAIKSGGGVPATQVCGGPIEILDQKGRCENLVFDQDFLRILQTEGLACARKAGRAAFGFTPTKIGLRTLQGQVSQSRRSSNGKKSTHSVGRALDIFEVDIYNGAANSSVLMHGSYMTRRGHRTFYTQFRDCWKGVIRGVKGGVAGTCGTGCLHFNSNAAHWNHMHISLPPLDRNRRSHGLNCT